MNSLPRRNDEAIVLLFIVLDRYSIDMNGPTIVVLGQSLMARDAADGLKVVTRV